MSRGPSLRFARVLLFLIAAIASSRLAAPAPAAGNTRPTVARIEVQVMREDGRRVVAFRVRDRESDAGSLAVTASSSNQALFPDAGLLVAGSGERRTITLAPTENRRGRATITIQASDGELVTNRSFAVRVLAVNDAPFFTSVPPTGATAGSVLTYHVTTDDVDPGDTRTVSVLTKPRWLRFSRVAGGGARLRGTPTLAQVGTHLVRLRVRDAAGAAARQSFLLTVVPPAAAAPVFDPPGGAQGAPVTVALATSTPGGAIRYSLDGTVPTETTGIPYVEPIALGSPALITAVAFAPGHLPSSAAAAEYLFAPGATTLGIDELWSDGATLAGSVDPRGLTATAWFEWGTDPALTSFAATSPVDLGDGSGEVPILEDLDALPHDTTFYYRVVAAGPAGTARGGIDFFALAPLDPGQRKVNSAEDAEIAPLGKMTLREAVAQVAPGGTITFAPGLNGRTIPLTLVGASATVLKGEVFTMGAGTWVFGGYQERNYGRSALYADKDLVIDASSLPGGVTFAWAGGDANRARVLAVYGDLWMRNVTITGGNVAAEPIAAGTQPFTLGRGGGLAVWGVARLEGCVIGGNRAEGDTTPSRDRGAFGGGVYADVLVVRDSVISGNAVIGYGAAGGGAYTVGGASGAWPPWVDPEWGITGSFVARTAITGNRVTGQHAYGGGIYTDGGGPGEMNPLRVEGCTVARNLVEDHPGLAESSMTQYYYRGGGIYMSNGWLELLSSTVAENEVTGVPHEFSGKPNMGGGGVAATVGNAHVVEDMSIWHSIIVGNLLGGVPEDVFTGSLIDFNSLGYNLVGVLDFSQILVPIPSWYCLSRRHWPKVGDQDGFTAAEVLDLDGARRHPGLLSAGADVGEPVVLWYPPAGEAVDRIPDEDYAVTLLWSQYSLTPDALVDDFPALALEKIRADYAGVLGDDFGATIDPAVVWYETAETWPADPRNAPWIAFWRQIDAEIAGRLGTAGLNDEFWGDFEDGPYGENVVMSLWPNDSVTIDRPAFDQLGSLRYRDFWADVGAVELSAALARGLR